MTKYELKSIINECIEEILYENKEDIQASYRARRASELTSHDHYPYSNSYEDLQAAKTGFRNANKPDRDRSFYNIKDDYNKRFIERRNEKRSSLK